MSEGLSAPARAESTSANSLVREKAKALFLQGVSPTEIAVLTSVNRETIYKWDQRYGWTELKAAIGLPPKHSGTVTITQQARAFALRTKLLAKAEKLFDGIPEKCPKQPRGFKDTMAGLAHASSAASVIEGWSDDFGQRIDVSWQSSPLEDVLPVPVQVLDAEPVPH